MRPPLQESLDPVEPDPADALWDADLGVALQAEATRAQGEDLAVDPVTDELDGERGVAGGPVDHLRSQRGLQLEHAVDRPLHLVPAQRTDAEQAPLGQRLQQLALPGVLVELFVAHSDDDEGRERATPQDRVGEAQGILAALGVVNPQHRRAPVGMPADGLLDDGVVLGAVAGGAP